MAKTILIVEDNEANLKMFNVLLRLEGYETLQSTDGKDVIELVGKHRPDLILMDIHLVDHSGLDLTRCLKAEPSFASIPVIAVTAFAMQGDEEMILAGGCDAYLSKPVDISVFLKTVARFISADIAAPTPLAVA